MKQNSSFLLKEIAGIPYLLPYGQMVADQMRGIRTNATGVWLWHLLKQEHSLEEVLSLSAIHYEVSAEELPDFRKEITAFLNHLLEYHILEEEPSVSVHPVNNSQLFCIGGLCLQISGEKDYIPSAFSDFSVSPAGQDIHQHI